MAYNFLAQVDNNIDWDILHTKIYKPNSMIELVPMYKLGINGSNALGISIPEKNTGILAWTQFESLLRVLIDEYHFRIFDLYYGVEVNFELIDDIKKNIL